MGYYSAIIKVACILVIRQAWLEVEEGSGDAIARLFSIVRAKVRRFMTTVYVDGYSTPIDWIFESGLYSLRI